ncbi:hypothetical protein OG338_24915 [Streptomyces sp. NBC_00726]|uniref:hypothetical protein n=1 Tax=Streptomyces sp. NBC_00726 TaxID=2903674 RepID=UPI0038688F0B
MRRHTPPPLWDIDPDGVRRVLKLKTTASDIRATGKDVHTAFQALDPVYDAPEQEELLDSTLPHNTRRTPA